LDIDIAHGPVAGHIRSTLSTMVTPSTMSNVSSRLSAV
jgi:hypothetical protein